MIINEVLPQDLFTTSSPTFAGLTMTAFSDRILSTSSGVLTSIDLDDWVAGTANQITVTDDTDGSVTLSLPQNIHTGASPTFVDLTLTNNLLLPANKAIKWDTTDILLTHSSNTLTFSGMSTLDLGSSVLVTTGASKGGEIWVTGPTISGPCKMLDASGFWGFHATGHADTGVFRFYGEEPKTGNNTTVLNLYGRGDPSDNTIRERLNISHTGGSLASIYTDAAGTGTGVRSLVLYTGANANQLYLHTNGSVGINTDGPHSSYKLDVNGNIQASSLYVGGDQVVGLQQADVADATGAGDVVAQLNALLSRLRSHGLIDS